MFELADCPVIVEVPVSWGHMDSYQHVNNAVYFTYFEDVRLEYFRRMGWFEFEEQTGIGPILAATQARYRKALTYPDTILVGAHVVGPTPARFTMHYRIWSRKLSAVATEGEGTIVAFNYKEGKKVPIPQELIQRIEELESRARVV